mmetsp:Transcript_26287/g.73769  ORF Transcript_26287/g.73769 Transcript_26287/m.73769 type:complete len:599 (+) Transcript_26287:550-2346(+)
MALSWEGWVTVLVLVVGLVVMATDKLPPDFVFMGMLGILLTLQIITLQEGLSGFSNSGLATVMVLFPVAEGISQTGGLDALFAYLLGKPSTLLMAQVRMMVPVALLSAFLNNTPIVALLVPLIFSWARGSHGSISPQKLLIPLSFASVFGGTCTLIGTSTNLVIAGLQADRAQQDPTVPVFGMFDITMYGFPYAVFGILYVLISSPALLPPLTKKILCCKAEESDDSVEELLVGLQVGQYSTVVGKTIEEAGLRSLEKLFLVSVERGGYVIPAVGPDFVLAAMDVIYFSGDLKGVKDLASTHGLHYVTDENEDDLFRTRVAFFGSPEKSCPPLRSPGATADKGWPETPVHAARKSIHASVLNKAAARSTQESNAGDLEFEESRSRQELPDLEARQFSLSRTSDPVQKNVKFSNGAGPSSLSTTEYSEIKDTETGDGPTPVSSPVGAEGKQSIDRKSVIPGLSVGVGPSLFAGSPSLPGSPKAPGPTNLLRAKLTVDSKLLGHSIRQVGFRRKMNASVVAVMRQGQRVSGKIGDIVLEIGDVLLLDAGKDFDRYSDTIKTNFESLETITEEARDFMVPMKVIDGSALIGKTVQVHTWLL